MPHSSPIPFFDLQAFQGGIVGMKGEQGGQVSRCFRRYGGLVISGGTFAFVQLATDKVVRVVAAVPGAAAAVPTTAASAANATSSAGPAATAAAATPIPSLQNFQFTQIHQSPLAAHFPWLTHFFAGTFLVSAIALVILLAVQTTKQEGLGGTIGGRVESSYRPRLGFDEQLQRITTFVAIVFVVFGTIVAISGI